MSLLIDLKHCNIIQYPQSLRYNMPGITGTSFSGISGTIAPVSPEHIGAVYPNAELLLPKLNNKPNTIV